MDDQPPPKRVKLRNEDDPGKLKIKNKNAKNYQCFSAKLREKGKKMFKLNNKRQLQQKKCQKSNNSNEKKFVVIE